jgi:hypothetical protein
MSDENTDTADALEMLGRGYHDEPATVIEPPRKTLRRKKGEVFAEHESPAWIKFSTVFKDELIDLSGNALKVWVFIALSMDYQGQAFPGVMTISAGVGLSHPTVLAAIHELENAHMLTVKREHRHVNLYTISNEFAAVGKTSIKNLSSNPEFDESETHFDEKDSRFDESGVSSNKNNKNEQEIRAARVKKSAAQKRGDVLDGMIHYSQEHRPEIEMRERFERCLGLSPAWDKHAPRDTWEGFDAWLVERDAAGQPIEDWARWWKADEFRVKTTINLTPDKIKMAWPQVFKAESGQSYDPFHSLKVSLERQAQDAATTD